MKLSGFLYMCGPRQTDSVSLMYFCTNLCRISFSICLNLIQIRNAYDTDNSYSDTYIEKYLNISLHVLNDDNENIVTSEFYFFYIINKFAPFFLLLFVVLIAFKVPESIEKTCKFKIFNSYGITIEDEIKEGHDYYMEINKKLNGEMIKVDDDLKLPEDKYNK